MARLAEYALTGFLSLVYIAMGFVKLYPTSQQMAFAIEFRSMLYSSVFPSTWLGYMPDADMYRVVTGTFEFTCGLAMLTWDRELRLGACGILMAILSVMIWSGLALGDYLFVWIYITRQFQGYAKVCPTVLFEFVPDPHKYRVFVGVWEVCCGLALFTGDRELKQGASGILLVIMSLMLISNALLKNYSTLFFFAMHFFFLSYLFARCCRKPVQLITEGEEEKDFKKEQ